MVELPLHVTGLELRWSPSGDPGLEVGCSLSQRAGRWSPRATLRHIAQAEVAVGQQRRICPSFQYLRRGAAAMTAHLKTAPESSPQHFRPWERMRESRAERHGEEDGLQESPGTVFSKTWQALTVIAEACWRDGGLRRSPSFVLTPGSWVLRKLILQWEGPVLQECLHRQANPHSPLNTHVRGSWLVWSCPPPTRSLSFLLGAPAPAL